MSREMLQLAEALASEKNVETEVVFKALEFALSTAAKKKADREHMDVRVEIDRDTGEYQTFRRWLIVADEDYTYPDVEKTIEESKKKFPAPPSKSANTTKSSCQTKASAAKQRKPPNKSSCNASAMPSASKT